MKADAGDAGRKASRFQEIVIRKIRGQLGATRVETDAAMVAEQRGIMPGCGRIRPPDGASGAAHAFGRCIGVQAHDVSAGSIARHGERRMSDEDG